MHTGRDTSTHISKNKAMMQAYTQKEMSQRCLRKPTITGPNLLFTQRHTSAAVCTSCISVRGHRNTKSPHQRSQSPSLSTTLARSGAWWATLNNHHRDNAASWNIHERPTNTQLPSFFLCSLLGLSLCYSVSPLVMSHCGGFISSAA